MKTLIALLIVGLLAAGITAWAAEVTQAAVPSEHSVVQIISFLLSYPGLEFIRLIRGMRYLPGYTEELKNWTIIFNGMASSLMGLGSVHDTF